jgi:hypothetical protein
MRPIQARVTTSNPIAYVRLDQFHGAALAVQAVIEGAPAHSAQTLAYLARTVGGNEGGNGANIATLIDGLVSDGVWAQLDCLYILAQQNVTDAQLNLIGTSYPIILDGSTFVSYNGFSGFTTGLNTGFNAATAPSPNYTQNSANYGIWSKLVANETAAQIGTSANGIAGESNILNNYSGTAFYGRINSTTGTSASVAQPGSKGLFVTERTSSSSTTLYWNGVSQGIVTDPSASPESGNFRIGAVPGSSDSGQTLCEAHIGASLGASLNLALYNRIRTYMTAVGVP